MKCPYCKIEMKKQKGIIEEDNFTFEGFKCPKCGEELLNMEQLSKLATKYRKLKNSKKVKFAKWGNSLAIRIPKESIEKLGIREGDEGTLIQDKNGLKIIPT